MDSTKGWLVAVAVLAFLGGIAAPMVPAVGSALAILAAGVALFRAFVGPGQAAESRPGLAGPSLAPGAARSGPPNATSARPLPTVTMPSPPPAVSPSFSPGVQNQVALEGSGRVAPTVFEASQQSGLPSFGPPPGSSLAPSAQGYAVYERLEKLGEGTMGELWLVRHRQLDRVAALKEIKGTGVDAEDIGRFNREARVLSRLHCPHTIQIYDYGVGPSGFPYYVMEYLEGVNLQTLVDQLGPVAPERAIHVLRQVSLSLEEAHEAGLVHRDIKPANVMLCHYGTEWDFAKLLDFGLVKRDPGQESSELTRDAVVLGTPAYLAPESLRGSKFVDGRADLYGLAAVGFHLVTGRLLFDHQHPLAMAKAHLLEEAPRASQRAPGPIPRELDDLLNDCLQKDPQRRPQTARAMIQRLEAIPLTQPWSNAHAQDWWTEYGKLLSARISRI